jgi:uncharacterized NAD(P)/FAD-binding protein YdhS
VRRHGGRLRVVLDDGTSRAADPVVPAIGNAPSTAQAPPQLRSSPRFVTDPWYTAAARTAPAGSLVVLVGAGLTMGWRSSPRDAHRPAQLQPAEDVERR